MHTENTIRIRGSLGRVFALAAATEDWPRLLPHYRAVSVTGRSSDGRRKVVEMAAVRPGFPLPGLNFPVRWRSVQVCEPDTGHIFFKHIGGLAVPMWVVWELIPEGDAVRVTIRHTLTYPFAFLNGWFAREIVGRLFVGDIAGRTLATLKRIVESETPS